MEQRSAPLREIRMKSVIKHLVDKHLFVIHYLYFELIMDAREVAMTELNQTGAEQSMSWQSKQYFVAHCIGLTALIAVTLFLQPPVFGYMVVFFSMVVYAVYEYMRPLEETRQFSPQPLYWIVFLWLLHSAVFRVNEQFVSEDGKVFRVNQHLINENMAFYFGLITGIMGILTYFDSIVDHTLRAYGLALGQLVFNLPPHHEHNLFHIPVYNVLVRCLILYVIFWMYMVTSQRRRAKTEERSEQAQIDIYHTHKFLVFKTMIRVAWIPFLPDLGLIIVTIVLLFFATIEPVLTRIMAYVGPPPQYQPVPQTV